MRPSTKSRRARAILTTAIALTAGVTLAGAPATITAALPFAAMVGPSSAYAGTWTQITCTQPVAGLPGAPTDGWAPFNGGGIATNSCDPYAGGLLAALTDAAPHFAGVGSALGLHRPARLNAPGAGQRHLGAAA